MQYIILSIEIDGPYSLGNLAVFDRGGSWVMVLVMEIVLLGYFLSLDGSNLTCIIFLTFKLALSIHESYARWCMGLDYMRML